MADPTSNADGPNRPVPAAAAPARRRSRAPWILALMAICAVVIWFVFFHHKPAESARAERGKTAGGQPPLLVGTTNAHSGEIGIYVTALGTVTPLNTVMVKSRVDGQLVRVNYTEGQTVKRGEALVDIDPSPFQAANDQAEGQLARDAALLENARIDLSRYQEAFSKNAIPKQQLDTQGATVHQDEGIVKLDKGALDNAKVQLGYTHIVAPISGKVGLRLVDAGNIVHASDANPLVVITEVQPITVVFNVAEDSLPQIQEQLRKGRQLQVDVFDRTQQKKLSTGRLQTLDNQIDTATGTIKLKAVFTNDDDALFPNQFVNVRVLVDTHTNVTLLANTAIQRNAQSAYVYLLKPDQTVAMQPITVGTTDGNVSEVENLEPGAAVAADNFNRLTDGAKVTVRSRDGAAETPGGNAGDGAPGGRRSGGQRKKAAQ